MDAPAPWLIVCVVCSWAGFTDLRHFRIRNELTYSLAFSGLGFHFIAAGGTGLVASFLGVLLAMALLAWPFSRGAIGGGDLKLLAGVGAWWGPYHLLEVALVTGVLVGCYSMAVLAIRGDLFSTIFPNRVLRVPNELASAPCPAASNNQVGAEVVPATVTIQSELQKSDRRKRLVPVAAMMAIAVGVITFKFWAI